MNLIECVESKNIPVNKHYIDRYIKFCQAYADVNPRNDIIEYHHILPKSLFPEYEDLKIHKWNGVYLSASAHMIAHWILKRALLCQETSFALWAMCTYNNEYNKSSRMYAEARKSHQEYVREFTRKTNTGYSLYKDIDGNTFRCKKDDPRVASGELVGINKGYIVAKHSITGERVRMKTTDERYLSGEYTHVNKGAVSKYRGTTMSDDRKLSHSKLMKEIMGTPEMQLKLSESHKGLAAHNKGILCTEEQKKKVSEATKAAMNTPEMLEKLKIAREITYKVNRFTCIGCKREMCSIQLKAHKCKGK